MQNKIIILVLLVLIVGGGYYYITKPVPMDQAMKMDPNMPMSDQNGTPIPGSSSSTPVTFTIVAKDAKLVSGGGNLQVKQGDYVALRITDNIDEELHLHGYDKMVNIPANTTAELDFVADKTGRFPFELEHEGIELGNLEVDPR